MKTVLCPKFKSPTVTTAPIASGVVDVCAAIGDALAESGHRDLRLVRCEFNSGTARLTGNVNSFYLKQVAQEIVRRIGSVESVDNRLQVKIR